MKKRCLPIVIPFFQENFDFFLDLIDSIHSYIKEEYYIIVVDDFSQDGSYEKLLDFQSKNKNVVILRNSKNQGLGWGAWLTIGAGLTWVYQNLEFEYVLKLDCDALLIGAGLDSILDVVHQNRRIGLIGHLQGKETLRWIWNIKLARKYKKLAKMNGFFRKDDENETFWSVHEGAHTISRDFIAALLKSNHFINKDACGGIYKKLFGPHGIMSGVLFAVLCYAYGFEAIDLSCIRSFSREDELHKVAYDLFVPMGIRVAHPLKKSSSQSDLNEKAREYFNLARGENV